MQRSVSLLPGGENEDYVELRAAVMRTRVGIVGPVTDASSATFATLSEKGMSTLRAIAN